MTLTSLDKDLDALTVTLTAGFGSPVERVWELFANPRKLERWWGPPGYPATFGEHDLTPGGMVRYYMTSPEGERYHGYWTVLAVTAPHSLEVSDGFADADGSPNLELPLTSMQVALAATETGTRMTLKSLFDTREQMEQVLAMGAAEGISLAVGQMDALLADAA